MSFPFLYLFISKSVDTRFVKNMLYIMVQLAKGSCKLTDVTRHWCSTVFSVCIAARLVVQRTVPGLFCYQCQTQPDLCTIQNLAYLALVARPAVQRTGPSLSSPESDRQPTREKMYARNFNNITGNLCVITKQVFYNFLKSYINKITLNLHKYCKHSFN